MGLAAARAQDHLTGISISLSRGPSLELSPSSCSCPGLPVTQRILFPSIRPSPHSCGFHTFWSEPLSYPSVIQCHPARRARGLRSPPPLLWRTPPPPCPPKALLKNIHPRRFPVPPPPFPQWGGFQEFVGGTYRDLKYPVHVAQGSAEGQRVSILSGHKSSLATMRFCRCNTKTALEDM